MINIAIVGYGRWGKRLYDYFSQKKEVRVKWIYNRTFVNVEKREIFTINLDDIIQDTQLDIVYIATSVKSHFSLLERLICHKNIIVEKPTFQNFSDFKKIKLKQQEKIFTNYIYYYSKGLNFLHEKIDLSAGGPFEFVVNISQQNLNDDNVLNNLFCHVVSIAIKFGLYNQLNSMLTDVSGNLSEKDYISISSFDRDKNFITLISDSRIGVSKKRYIYFKNLKSSYYLDFKSDESIVYINHNKQIPNQQSVSTFSEKDNFMNMINASLVKKLRTENLSLSKEVMMVLDQIRYKH